jgi:hypothetical protein
VRRVNKMLTDNPGRSRLKAAVNSGVTLSPASIIYTTVPYVAVGPPFCREFWVFVVFRTLDSGY